MKKALPIALAPAVVLAALVPSFYRAPAQAPPPQAEAPIWVAIEFADQEGGLSAEYIGRVRPADLEALRQGRLQGGYLELLDVFWLVEDGTVERIEDDAAFLDSSNFRVDRILRWTPVREEFARDARRLNPEQQILPGRVRSS